MADNSAIRDNYAQKGYIQASKYTWDDSAKLFIESIEKLLLSFFFTCNKLYIVYKKHIYRAVFWFEIVFFIIFSN